ncbi:hypothetical protein AAC387_Pa07g2256 [Persea americana]
MGKIQQPYLYCSLLNVGVSEQDQQYGRSEVLLDRRVFNCCLAGTTTLLNKVDVEQGQQYYCFDNASNCCC